MKNLSRLVTSFLMALLFTMSPAYGQTVTEKVAEELSRNEATAEVNGQMELFNEDFRTHACRDNCVVEQKICNRFCDRDPKEDKCRRECRVEYRVCILAC